MSYTLSSDQHCHSWSQFAVATPDNVNSRLRIILDELLRQAEETKRRGWKRMRLAGDLFHVRGKIEPSVLNPTVETFKQISSMGLLVDAIAGNHDLEFSHANQLGNAMQSLAEIPGFTAITAPALLEDGVFMVPWIEDLDELRRVLKTMANPMVDAIIHAPVNGVIKGLPDHGLEVAELAALGFRRVFAGHYHDHKSFDGGIYSIGATSHQNWSDPGTLAGFCAVAADKVEHIESTAPKFMDVDRPVDPNDARIGGVRGHYVRLRLQDVEEKAIKATRQACVDAGALGIVDHSSKKRETVRGQTNIAPGQTLEAAVSGFVKDHLVTTLDRTRIGKMALDVLAESTSASLNQ